MATRAEAAERLERYFEKLEAVIGHADRAAPLRAYVKGLLLPGERKSIEPMAAKIAPRRVQARHQSMHHFVASAPWDECEVMRVAREYAREPRERHAPVGAWGIDDTGIPKKGRQSVGVTRQYCGQLGKQDNCQVVVTLSLVNAVMSVPAAYRLYLPEIWAQDRKRCRAAGVPQEIAFRKKWESALEGIDELLAEALPRAPVVADAGYGIATEFREQLTARQLLYAVGISEDVTVWPEGAEPLRPPAPSVHRMGRPRKLLRRDDRHKPRSVKALAFSLPAAQWKAVRWRDGTRGAMRSRFAALRVRAAQRDYQAMKDELGLGHYEGRGWRGFHHHGALCIAAYAFLAAERARLSPPTPLAFLRSAPVPKGFRPRGAAPARGAA
jgi:SRSO17 transposase